MWKTTISLPRVEREGRKMITQANLYSFLSNEDCWWYFRIRISLPHFRRKLVYLCRSFLFCISELKLNGGEKDGKMRKRVRSNKQTFENEWETDFFLRGKKKLKKKKKEKERKEPHFGAIVGSGPKRNVDSKASDDAMSSFVNASSLCRDKENLIRASSLGLLEE